MSLDATVWAWKQRIKQNSRTSRSAVKIVLVSLADRAGEDHTCYPSISRLELDTELNRKTILNALRYLEEIGLIRDTGERKGRTRKVKVYALIGVDGREDSSTANTNSSESGTVKNNSPESGTITSAKQSQIGNSTENGMIPNLPANRPKNGTTKQSQIRYSELPSIELTNEPPNSCASVPDDARVEKWVSAKGKKLSKLQQQVFATLWDAYKQKADRAKAIDAFLKIIWPMFGHNPESNRATLAKLLSAIKKHVETRSPDHTPLYFERWIRNRRWEDEPTGAAASGAGAQPGRPAGDPDSPGWMRAGFASFEQMTEFSTLSGELKNLLLIKTPSEHEKMRMENIRNRLKLIAPRKPELEAESA